MRVVPKSKPLVRLTGLKGFSLINEGFSLIEMMIALLLGLLVIAGVISIFLASQQTYRTNQALGDIQSSARTAFELLARDIRVAGLSGCNSTSGRVANVINNSSTLWYANWSQPLVGYDNAQSDPALSGLTGAGAPVAGTSSVHILSTGSVSATISFVPDKNSANFHINEANPGLAAGDIVMVCDYDHSALVQITNYNNGQVVVHNTGAGTPGNCSKGLGYPTSCSNATGNAYAFPPNSQIAKLSALVWYIGTNPVGGSSLYRLAATNVAGAISATPQEMVRGVTGLTLSYLQPPAKTFATASGISNWNVVTAVQVALTFQSVASNVSASGTSPLTRNFSTTVAIRNRVQ